MPQVVGPGGEDSYAEEQADASANYSTAVHQRDQARAGLTPDQYGWISRRYWSLSWSSPNRVRHSTAAPPGS